VARRLRFVKKGAGEGVETPGRSCHTPVLSTALVRRGGAGMTEQGTTMMLRGIMGRGLDARALATPVAIVTPVLLVLDAQNWAITIVSVLFVYESWRTADWSWTREAWFRALLALWLYAVARTLVGAPTATGVLTALQWIHYPVYAAALAVWILPQPQARERLIWATVGVVAFFAADCALQYFAGRDIIGRPKPPELRVTSVFRKPGVGVEIAWLFLPAAAALWAKGYVRRAAALLLAALAAILFTGDRMALVIGVVSFLSLGVVAPRARKAVVVGAAAAVVLGGALALLNPWLYNRQVSSSASVIARVDQSIYGVIFRSGWAVIKDHTMFGVGVTNYNQACSDPRYGPVLTAQNDKRCQGHPHNIYLQWFAETGAVGLALYLAFVVLSLRKLVRRAAGRRDDLVYLALAVCLFWRFWPIQTSTSFYSSWSAGPLFLLLGWAFASDRSEREDG
jgi:O-antigen ligase